MICIIYITIGFRYGWTGTRVDTMTIGLFLTPSKTRPLADACAAFKVWHLKCQSPFPSTLGSRECVRKHFVTASFATASASTLPPASPPLFPPPSHLVLVLVFVVYKVVNRNVLFFCLFLYDQQFVLNSLYYDNIYHVCLFVKNIIYKDF